MFHTVSKLVKMNILNMVILIFLTLNIQTTCTCKTLETFVVCSLFWWNLKALLFALLWGKMKEKKQRKENERELKEHIIQNFSLFFFHSIIEKMRENIIWYYYHIWEYEKRVEIVGASITKNTMFWPFTLFIFFLIFNFLNLLYYHL